MHTTIHKQIKNIALFFLVCLNTTTLAASNSQNFFSSYWDDSPLVVFHYKAGDVERLNYASFDFFAVDDCQTKFMAHHRTPPNSFEFPIAPSKDFALMSDKAYQIAMQALPEQEIDAIHSMLIRFRGTSNEIPHFLSGCADERSNCCIAIQCSNSAGVCLPKYTFPRQSFILFSDYE